jgi:DNA polymerase III sliding clamp (beta) subunit (PCNA family)
VKMKRIKLLNALESVKPGLDPKCIIEQSNCFVFVNNQVATYNDVVAVSYPIEINIEGAVRSQELSSLLSKIKDQEIEVFEEENELRMNGARFKSGISLEKEITLPLDFLKKKFDFKPLPEGFVEAIKRCAFSAAKESDAPHLSNIHVQGDMVESCDNFRATRCTIKKMKDEMLLPAAGIKGLINFHFDHYCQTDGWIHLTKEGGAVFSCRTYEDDYPDLSPFFETKGRPVRLPKELNEILDRGNIFSAEEESQDTITITVAPKEIIIRGENEVGWFEEKSDIRRQGSETIKFSISPNILKDILKFSSKGVVGDRSMKFKAQHFDHVVALIPK